MTLPLLALLFTNLECQGTDVFRHAIIAELGREKRPLSRLVIMKGIFGYGDVTSSVLITHEVPIQETDIRSHNLELGRYLR